MRESLTGGSTVSGRRFASTWAIWARAAHRRAARPEPCPKRPPPVSTRDRGVDPLGVLQSNGGGSEGGGTGLRVPGAVQAADAPGEDHRLSHGHRHRQAVSAVGLTDRQTVFVQGGYIFIEGMVLRQIGELAGIGFAADKVVRAVLPWPERERSSETVPAAGTALCFFMECHSFPEVRTEDADPPRSDPPHRG